MIKPIRPQAGQRIPKNWFRDLYDYIMAATTIRGDKKNIAVSMTDGGQIIKFIGKRGTPSGGGSGGGSKYSGPWALYIDYGKIKAKRGLMWTPDVSWFSTATPCDVPNSTKYILVSDAFDLSAESEDELTEHIAGQAHYLDTHVVLGLYDASSQKIIQYHFSPVVYMIQTQEFIVQS